MSRKVFGFIPVSIEYTEEFEVGSAGTSSGLTLYIRPDYANDEGLIQHELEHVKQMLRGLWIFHTLLWYSATYRKWCEAKAYKVQMQYPDANGTYLSLDAAGERLSRPLYGFGITQAEAAAYIASV